MMDFALEKFPDIVLDPVEDQLVLVTKQTFTQLQARDLGRAICRELPSLRRIEVRWL